MNSEKLHEFMFDLFSMNWGNERIAIKSLKTDPIKIIISRREVSQLCLNSHYRQRVTSKSVTPDRR